ncbi:Piwi-domain-containing protein [Ascobolus immersus RN42]|uniref:Piwi-domain-containing protein n=1 Tax=Ascobolus immersus RN42 TaxID=1160509 RepID=A0A3N4I8C2_ASCIM|nr:Piwi-domain-containing protein [Ascobolus immersus RN42]
MRSNMIKFIVRLLRSYRFHTNAIPERIMYFRDGVSEGQYAQIIAEELRDLKAACKTLEDTYNPLGRQVNGISLVVSGTRGVELRY